MASAQFERSVQAMFGTVTKESLYELKLLAFFSVLAVVLLLANIVYWRVHADTLSEVYLNPQKFSIDGDAALISHVTVGVEYKVASAQAAADTVAGNVQEGLHGEQVSYEQAASLNTPSKSSSNEASVSATRSARALSASDGVQLGRFTIPRSLKRSPPPSSVGRTSSFLHGHAPSDLTMASASVTGEEGRSPAGKQEQGDPGTGTVFGRPPRHSQARTVGRREGSAWPGRKGATCSEKEVEGAAPAPASPTSTASAGTSQQRFTTLLQSVQGLASESEGEDVGSGDAIPEQAGEERSDAGSMRSGLTGAGRRSMAEGSVDDIDGGVSAAMEELLGPLIDDGDSVVEDGDSVFIEHPPSAVKAGRRQGQLGEEDGTHSPAYYGFQANGAVSGANVGHDSGTNTAGTPSSLHQGEVRKRPSRGAE